jgi:hypothetical protein
MSDLACVLSVMPQAVRKNGSGYYLVLHPLHPAAGRPDFVPWLLGKQQDGSLIDIPPTVFDSKPVNQAQRMASQHLKTALSLRQMSKDLGAVAAGKAARNPDATMGMLANLGIPVPGVTKPRPAPASAAMPSNKGKQQSEYDDEVRTPACAQQECYRLSSRPTTT